MNNFLKDCRKHAIVSQLVPQTLYRMGQQTS